MSIKPIEPQAPPADFGAEDHFADDAHNAVLRSKEALAKEAAKSASDAANRARAIDGMQKRVDASEKNRGSQQNLSKKEDTRQARDPRREGSSKADGVSLAKGVGAKAEVEALSALNSITEILGELHEGGLDTLMKNMGSDIDLARISEFQLDQMRGPMAERIRRITVLLQRLQQAEMRAKLLLMHVVTGGTGLQLLNDPRATFRELFKRINEWPRRVKPGKFPETDEEFDEFIAWIFAPPGMPDPL